MASKWQCPCGKLWHKCDFHRQLGLDLQRQKKRQKEESLKKRKAEEEKRKPTKVVKKQEKREARANRESRGGRVKPPTCKAKAEVESRGRPDFSTLLASSEDTKGI